MERGSRRLEWLLLIAILALSGFLRVRDLDVFVASDELRWACRSINFHAALDEGRLAETFQVGHPGVITMWLGVGPEALSLEETGAWRDICRETRGGRDLGVFEDQGRHGEIQSLAPLLPKLRRGIALGSTALLFLVYLLLRKIIRRDPRGIALSALALLAFEPLVLAHSKVIHVDIMLSLLLLATVLALAAASATSMADPAQQVARGSWPWALAGVLAGLSMLAKSAGFIIGPVGLALALLAGSHGRRENTASEVAQDDLPGASIDRGPFSGFRSRLLPAFAFLLAAGLAYTLFWPAMWVAPVETLIGACESETKCHEGGVFSKLFAEGGEPHQNGSYFRGRPVADPGMLYYPLVVLLRPEPAGLGRSGACHLDGFARGRIALDPFLESTEC